MPDRVDQLDAPTVRLLVGGDAIRPGDHDTGWRSMGWTLILTVRRAGYRVELDGGAPAEVLVPPGHVLVLPPRRRHRITVADGRSHVHVTWAHVQCPMHDGTDLLDGWTFPLVLGDAGAIARHLDRVVAAGAQAGVAAGCRQQEALYALVAELLARGEELPRHRRLPELAPVLRHMRAHLDRPLDRGSLAALAGLSPTRFHDVFSAVIGVSPMRFLRRLRVDQAKRELAGGDADIADIAARCGFPDPYHFSRVFRSMEGISPSAWRQRMRRSG